MQRRLDHQTTQQSFHARTHPKPLLPMFDEPSGTSLFAHAERSPCRLLIRRIGRSTCVARIYVCNDNISCCAFTFPSALALRMHSHLLMHPRHTGPCSLSVIGANTSDDAPHLLATRTPSWTFRSGSFPSMILAGTATWPLSVERSCRLLCSLLERYMGVGGHAGQLVRGWTRARANSVEPNSTPPTQSMSDRCHHSRATATPNGDSAVHSKRRGSRATTPHGGTGSSTHNALVLHSSSSSS